MSERVGTDTDTIEAFFDSGNCCVSETFGGGIGLDGRTHGSPWILEVRTGFEAVIPAGHRLEGNIHLGSGFFHGNDGQGGSTIQGIGTGDLFLGIAPAIAILVGIGIEQDDRGACGRRVRCTGIGLSG